jgi:hypothetical protein
MATLGRRLATVIERVDLPDCVEEPAGPITRLPNVRSRRLAAVNCLDARSRRIAVLSG